jgi:hypothetical protein
VSSLEINCLQGSIEWEQARMGVVTASELHRIVTPKRKKLSDTRHVYMDELLSEWRLGYHEGGFGGSYWTERGHEMEVAAYSAIEFFTDTKLRPVGFVYRDLFKRVGCSPDALIGDDGGAEIKSPKLASTYGHGRAVGAPEEHSPQVQGCMWVTGRKWWIFASYHPAATPLIVRVDADKEWHAALDLHIPPFIAELEERKAVERSKGFTSPLEHAPQLKKAS